MATRNNIGKIKSTLDQISRRSDLYFAQTQYGLGETAASEIGYTADDPTPDEPNREYLWGIHRWGSRNYKIGK